MPEISSLIPIQVDLDAGLTGQPLRMTLAAGNANAHQLHFTALRSGVPVDLTGVQVSGACLRADGSTVPLAGAIVNGAAILTLSAACYAVSGLARLSLTLSYGGVTATHLLALLQVDATTTDLIVDPEGVLPSLAELLAEIDTLRGATAAANAAAEYANQAASAALNTTLYLMGAASPVIIQSANGDGIVSVSDSAERSLSGLSVYGKTTQGGTPTPEAPVPMVNVAHGGSIVVQVRGKNMVDAQQLYASAFNTEVSIDGNSVRVYTTADGIYKGARTPNYTFRKGVKYTLSCKVMNITSGDVRAGLRRGAADAVGNINQFFSGTTVVFSEPGYKSISFTPDYDWYGYLALLVTWATTEAGDATFADIQLEVGASATSYEPFKDGGSMTALTPNGLPGLPVTSGGNYIDSTGQQWICDEIDFTRKVYVQRLRTLTLDGNQSVQWYTGTNMPYGGAIQFVLNSTYYAAVSHKNDSVSDRFVNKLNVAADYTHGVFGITTSGQSMFFAIEGVSDADAAKAWLAANPTNILYALATPIEIPLSPEELTGSTSLTAQYPNTTAFNDGGAGMKMEYIADTKIYIDQRIAALLNA